MKNLVQFIIMWAFLPPFAAGAVPADSASFSPVSVDVSSYLVETQPVDVSEVTIDCTHCAYLGELPRKHEPVSIYSLPYSTTLSNPNSHRLWVNTAVLASAFVGTLLVLECLPEDATSWNRAELQDVPLFERWYDHVIKKGPEWDHDNPIFNYVLHPYAGAVYFMGARSNGYNFYQSLLYSAAVSTIGWEFGIEAFMERPSIQDIFITPLCGAIIGEAFYKMKRSIVENGYTLFGSPVLGTIAAFLLDPLNEVVGIFIGNPARHAARAQLQFTPAITPAYQGFALTLTF